MDQAPVFILCRPQLGENIGACARVMGNFAISDLRIVAPRDGWPNPAAETMAAGSPVLSHAKVFDTLEEAAADCHALYATTGTPRHMVKPVVTGREAMDQARADIAAGQRIGVMFGAEKSGHSNEEIAKARAVISLPVDPEFTSLNLAMACGVLAHEWRAGEGVPEGWKPMEAPASQGELDGLYGHLHDELDRAVATAGDLRFAIQDLSVSLGPSFRRLVDIQEQLLATIEQEAAASRTLARAADDERGASMQCPLYLAEKCVSTLPST